MNEFASIDGVITGALSAWKPPPRLSLSEWAEEHFYLSAQGSAEPGRWKTIPYQHGIMDAFTDPTVETVAVMKSARVGWTEIVKAVVGYSIHQDPSTIMVVQPTVEDAKGFSKEGIAPMLRDSPALSQIVFEDSTDAGPKDSGNTILHKTFPGGVLSLVGANSGTGLRRVARRRVLFDEVDAYPPSAGSDGDPIKLGIRRAETYWNRKIGAGSTPLVAGTSRIEQMFEAGDQRRYFVPCLSCGHMAPFVFSGDKGHAMTWPEGKPEEAFFTCQRNGCVIEHKDKRVMVERGEWRAVEWNEDAGAWAPREFKGHASFHIWAAYSYTAQWKEIAAEFLASKGKPEQLRTFVNTWLGETWKERGEAPDWERLYSRREAYSASTVPDGALVLTAGVDVQKDRFVYEVVAWGAGKESWSVDTGVLPGDPAQDEDWAVVDELLATSYSRADGTSMAVRFLAVDSGFNTNAVYNWARKHVGRVIAVKGVTSAKTLLGAPTAVDVNHNGKRITRGVKVWPVGVDVAKSELYGWLRSAPPKEGEPVPSGYCHFPEYGEDYFKQLTAEHLVSSVDKNGFTRYEWQVIPGRENHWLDCRVLARAAAQLAGLDRMKPRAPVHAPQAAPQKPPDPPDATAGLSVRTHDSIPPPAPRAPKPQRSGFLRGDKFLRPGKKGWLR